MNSTWLFSVLLAVSGAAGEEPGVDYLSEHPEFIVATTQAWGVLGTNTAAHAPDRAGAPLQIGPKRYAKGLGHHAQGALILLLDDRHETFAAEVGLQPCDGDSGSVIFRVFVDGEKRFESSVMRAADSPKPVRVVLAGAQELRLEADDAGDGITCDMANWAEARLIRSAKAATTPARPDVDIAPFGQVMTWDPNRKHGTRAHRVEEFPAQDLFLGTKLEQDGSGVCALPTHTNGLACVGLEWLNRRALRRLVLEFAGATPSPPADAVQLEGWFGESRWQGEWRVIEGQLATSGRELTFDASPKSPVGGLLETWKIRWIFPAQSGPVTVQRLSAFTRSRWDTAALRVQWDTPLPPDRRLEIINGEIVSPAQDRRPDASSWPVTVRYSRPSSFYSDPTVLRFLRGETAVGVAVEDVLREGAVCLPDFGLVVCRADAPTDLAACRREIAARKTILQEVRERPEQTLTQALAKTHHEAQNEGPVLLALACDNAKWVLERRGDLLFQPTRTPPADWLASAARMTVRLAEADGASTRRHLDGGWLPVLVITTETRQGLVLCQRTFVAPCDEPGTNPSRLNRRPVCVAEFTLSNAQPAAVDGRLDLSFQAKRALRLESQPTALIVLDGDQPIGRVISGAPNPLTLQVAGNALVCAGTLPPAGKGQVTVYLSPENPDFASLPSSTALRAALEDYWRAVLAPATQIETPEPFLNDVIRSSQVRCLIAARSEADGARVAPWIAAMTYGPLESEAHSIIRGMDYLGHADFARRGLDYFIHRYNPQGFLTTGYTTFGTAWHLWTLGEHWQLVRDTNWVRSIAPEIARVGHWIVRQIENTKRAAQPDDPEYGLMPPAVMADWNSYACHFMLNAYYHAALRELGATLADIGHPDAATFTRAATELRANTERAYRWTQGRSPALRLRNGAWIPHYPSQVHSPGPLARFFPGQDAGRAWAYDTELGAHQLVPTGVLDPFSPEVERIMDHMEDVQFLGEGWFDYPAAENQRDWFNLGGFAKVQPYYARNGEIYALRNDVKPFLRTYFNSLASLLNREVLTLWEHFRHSGAWDKTHETGYFLHQTRLLLVQERGDELWLAPLLPAPWLRDGAQVKVANAPTRFGPVAFRIHSTLNQGFVEATVEPPTRSRPKAIVLRLRHPEGRTLREVTVNERPHAGFNPTQAIVTLPPEPRPLRIRAFFADR